MKKALTLTLVFIMLVTSTNAALAKCTVAEPVKPVAIAGEGTIAVTNGDNSGDNNGNKKVTQTASSGGVNQSVTVQGNGNGVNVSQTVNADGCKVTYDQRTVVHETTVNEVTVIQIVATPEPTPEPEQHTSVDISWMIAATKMSAETFLSILADRLQSAGWTMAYDEIVSKTHNYVVRATFARGRIQFCRTLLYYTSDGERYSVAIATSYHEGVRVAEYPDLEFSGPENTFSQVLIAWLELWYKEFVTISVAECGCCKNCSCGGACHPGCGCECAADLGGITEPATAPSQAGAK